MIARISTWLFYAVVFFFIGVWVGGFSPGLRALMREGASAAAAGFERLHQWADSSIGATPSAPAPQSAAASDDLVRSARAAFARGDISKAIAAYQDRLQQEPEDIDARGELGNVLQSSGRLEEAAAVYYATAVRLAGAGDAARARALAPIIRRSDGGLADRLEAEIKAIAADSRQSALAPSAHGRGPAAD